MFFFTATWGYLFNPGNSNIIAWKLSDPAHAVNIDSGGTLGGFGEMVGAEIYWVSANGSAIFVFDTTTNKFLAQIQPA